MVNLDPAVYEVPYPTNIGKWICQTAGVTVVSANFPVGGAGVIPCLSVCKNVGNIISAVINSWCSDVLFNIQQIPHQLRPLPCDQFFRVEQVCIYKI